MTSRAAALQRLSVFQERIPSYAHQRNFDRPNHEEVSQLSQWIRYRVLTEEECVTSVLAHHPFEVAEKFVQEVMWRTYWKGWLELRPHVWMAYRQSVETLHAEYATNEPFCKAVEGRTGLLFFDDWVQELRATGYLHNHTRMWFASVWIFTLQLPWQLGAEFMYRHLVDGDPASNTLSWRWVGGLHTPGKIYVARPDNIAKYSDGRWCPKASDLNPSPQPLPLDDNGAIVPLELVTTDTPRSGECILLHDDDLSADLGVEFSVPGLSFLQWSAGGAYRSEVVRDHVARLRHDTRERTNAIAVESIEAVLQEMAGRSTKVLRVMKPHCGELHADIMRLTERLSTDGIEVVFHRRGWDELHFPYAKSGFFSFWTSVRRKLERGETFR